MKKIIVSLVIIFVVACSINANASAKISTVHDAAALTMHKHVNAGNLIGHHHRHHRRHYKRPGMVKY